MPNLSAPLWHSPCDAGIHGHDVTGTCESCKAITENKLRLARREALAFMLQNAQLAVAQWCNENENAIISSITYDETYRSAESGLATELSDLLATWRKASQTFLEG